MNIELAEKVLTHIKAHPESFDMSYGIESGYGTHHIDSYPCGTVACIAGWTILLSHQDRRSPTAMREFVQIVEREWDWHGISNKAQRLLGITSLEAWSLFTPDNYLSKKATEEAIARFEEFIESKKRTL